MALSAALRDRSHSQRCSWMPPAFPSESEHNGVITPRQRVGRARPGSDGQGPGGSGMNKTDVLPALVEPVD